MLLPTGVIPRYTFPDMVVTYTITAVMVVDMEVVSMLAVIGFG